MNRSQGKVLLRIEIQTCVFGCVCAYQQYMMWLFFSETPFTFIPSLLDGECSFKRHLVDSSFFSLDLMWTPLSCICTGKCKNWLTSNTNINLRTACSPNSTHTCIRTLLDASFLLCLYPQMWVEQACVSGPPQAIWHWIIIPTNDKILYSSHSYTFWPVDSVPCKWVHKVWNNLCVVRPISYYFVLV